MWEAYVGECAWLGIRPDAGSRGGLVRRGAVYIYNPDTDSCTSQTYPGVLAAEQQSRATTGTGQQCEGTYGRFRYFPSLGVFILVNDISENAYSLRLAVAR